MPLEIPRKFKSTRLSSVPFNLKRIHSVDRYKMPVLENDREDQLHGCSFGWILQDLTFTGPGDTGRVECDGAFEFQFFCLAGNMEFPLTGSDGCGPGAGSVQIGMTDLVPGAEYKKLGAGKISDRKSNESRETACSREMILRALRAVGYGQTLPEWDRSVLKVEDGSPGGNQAIAAAGLLPDQGYNCHVFIPWRCDPGGVTSGRPGSWRPDYTPALRCFDPVHHAKRIRHSAGINAGLADYGCPPSGGPHRGRGSDSWFCEEKNNFNFPFSFPEEIFLVRFLSQAVFERSGMFEHRPFSFVSGIRCRRAEPFKQNSRCEDRMDFHLHRKRGRSRSHSGKRSDSL